MIIMNRIVKILMDRDGVSELEALERVNMTRELIIKYSYDYELCEEIMAGELGLEMDYIHDLLY